MRGLFMMLVACATTPDKADAPTDTVDDTDTEGVDAACGADEQVVRFPTEDGVTLEADWRPAPAAGAGVVILVHMIPPGNDRSGYPRRVRDALAATGVGMLNLDRRGAGGSTGVAKEAYTGPGGQHDVAAAVQFVLGSACAPDRTKILLVGASNGTTSVHDYAAAPGADLPAPAAMAWLSPGTYTVLQNAVGSAARSVPLLWLFPTNEPWSKDFVDGAPAAWTFVERGEQHGTRMFDSADLEASTLTDLVAFVRDQVGTP